MANNKQRNNINQNFGGLILINKPSDQTSFSMIRFLRQLTGVQRIGHCGTLDPFAEGLLPVLLGKYTRLASFLEAQEKVYEVKIVLGNETDTLDLTGKIIHSTPIDQLQSRFQSGDLDRALERALPSFVGEITQIPPMYSAIKVDGKALYRYAREGQEIERKPRKVTIYEAVISQVYEAEDQLCLDARVRCSKGTYIRSWVSDLVRQIGTYAYAKQLTRISIGQLSLADSVTPAYLKQLFIAQQQDKKLFRESLEQNVFYDLSQALGDYPVYDLKQDEAQKVLYGQKFLPDKNTLFCQNQAKVQNMAQKITLQLVYNNTLLAMAEYDPEKRTELTYNCVFPTDSVF